MLGEWITVTIHTHTVGVNWQHGAFNNGLTIPQHRMIWRPVTDESDNNMERNLWGVYGTTPTPALDAGLLRATTKIVCFRTVYGMGSFATGASSSALLRSGETMNTWVQWESLMWLNHSLGIFVNGNYGVLEWDAVQFGLPLSWRQLLPPHFLPWRWRQHFFRSVDDYPPTKQEVTCKKTVTAIK